MSERNINVNPMFILAGDATFTVSNGAGEHYTYHVYKSEPSDKFPNPAWFVKVLTGSDNENDYTYVGMLELTTGPIVDKNHIIRLTRNSRFHQTDKIVKVLEWSLRAIWETKYSGYQLPEQYSIRHSGNCGRCGRKLTVLASLDTGLGEECASIVGIEWRERGVQVGLPI
jgi:hypothetical protein